MIVRRWNIWTAIGLLAIGVVAWWVVSWLGQIGFWVIVGAAIASTGSWYAARGVGRGNQAALAALGGGVVGGVLGGSAIWVTVQTAMIGLLVGACCYAVLAYRTR